MGESKRKRYLKNLLKSSGFFFFFFFFFCNQGLACNSPGPRGVKHL